MKYLFLVVSLFICSNSFAQDPCITHSLAEAYTLTNPQALLEYNSLKQVLPIIKSDALYDIPVVFHIVHNGDALGANENIDEAFVLAQLAAMNRDFQLLNGDTTEIPSEFDSSKANAQISFCLAKQDTLGNPTTGIVRHNINQSKWSLDSIQNFLQPSTIWERQVYLNIWICKFGGTLETNNVLGFAQPPLASFPASRDGIVMNYEEIGANGRTLTHEIGHYLGLYHIWGDDGGLCSTDAGGSDDGLSDTPDQGGPNYNCPAFAISSCGSSDMFMNYMDYTNDDCSLMFTAQQVNNMHAALQGFRTNLVNANSCTILSDLAITDVSSPVGTICQKVIYPRMEVSNLGTGNISSFDVSFYVENVLIETISSSFGLNSQSNRTLQFSPYEIGTGPQNGTFRLENIIGSGPDYPYNNISAFTFSGVNTGSGIMTPFMEDFNLLTSFPPNNFFLSNPANDETWELYTDQMVVINNDASLEPTEDYLFTTDVNINIDSPTLTFDYAYVRPQVMTANDRLAVEISQDCGLHWIVLWEKTGWTLSDGIEGDTLFEPQFSEMMAVSISLDQFDTLQKARIRFNYSGTTGAPLYLDNINIKKGTVSSIRNLTNSTNLFSPNPFYNLLNFNADFGEFESVEFYNNTGKLIFSTSERRVIDTDLWDNGLYFVLVKTKDGVFSQKLLKH